jgi:ferric-dicitrate binding protein FerR (iron transport regulator)
MKELKNRLREWNNPPEPDEAQRELLRIKQREMRKRIADYEATRRSNSTVVWRRTLSYAAVFAGIILLTTLTLRQFYDPDTSGNITEQYMELSNPSSKLPVRYLLPDKSEVYLAAGSTLKYPRSFSASDRHVVLQGEAFFDVTRDESRPFSIRSGKMKTRVLGTSFKITAFDGLENEVAVASGKVFVSFDGEDNAAAKALLTRGAMVRYNPHTGEAEKGTVDVQRLEKWKRGTLFFNDQPMSLVAQQLKDRYGINIVFADREAAGTRISGTFGVEETASGILNMLGFVGKFKYEIKNEREIIIHSLK